jgi:hypothetical protein
VPYARRGGINRRDQHASAHGCTQERTRRLLRPKDGAEALEQAVAKVTGAKRDRVSWLKRSVMSEHGLKKQPAAYMQVDERK